MNTLSFLKIECKCGYLTLIPISNRILVDGNVNCEQCGKRILEVER